VEFLETLIKFRDGVELMGSDLVMFIMSVMWFHELHSSLPRQHHGLQGILRAILYLFQFYNSVLLLLQATACNTMLLVGSHPLAGLSSHTVRLERKRSIGLLTKHL
jgi:hypothetical protein